MLGAVLIEVVPTSPSSVDPSTMKGEMFALVYSQWCILTRIFQYYECADIQTLNQNMI